LAIAASHFRQTGKPLALHFSKPLIYHKILYKEDDTPTYLPPYWRMYENDAPITIHFEEVAELIFAVRHPHGELLNQFLVVCELLVRHVDGLVVDDL
jgi:hypothetical protein